jgi:hypothetical protein
MIEREHLPLVGRYARPTLPLVSCSADPRPHAGQWRLRARFAAATGDIVPLEPRADAEDDFDGESGDVGPVSVGHGCDERVSDGGGLIGR